MRRGCLFCRGTDGGFSSVEHIIPESLGNTELILPAGVVCNDCNNGVCAQLDHALLNFYPIAMLRTLQGIPTKSGSLPSVHFDNGSVITRAPGDVVIQLDSRRWDKSTTIRDDGQVQGGFRGQKAFPPSQVAMVHRAIVKVAVELAWLDLGEDLVLSSAFDREREIVTRGGHHGYLAMLRDHTPRPHISVSYERNFRSSDNEPGLLIRASFLGFDMFVNTLFSEPHEVSEDVQVFSF